MQKEEATEIEVEVVEIDGVAPVVPQERAPEDAPRHDWQDWRQWQGRVSRLDGRWWPLWVILGTIAVVLFLAFGLVIAAVYMVVRIFLKLVRAVLR